MIAKEFSYVDGPNGRLASLTVNCHPNNLVRVIAAHGYSPSNSMVEHAKLFMQTAESAAHQYDMGFILFDFGGNGLSDGYFNEISPNRRIEELVVMIDNVTKKFSGPVCLLGLSMGGAVSVYAALKRKNKLAGLVTWSCVPSFEPSARSAHWYPAQPNYLSSESVGKSFYANRPLVSIAETYKQLNLPKLQIQGDQDFAFFAEEFKPIFESAQQPKEWLIVPGADHVFTDASIRNDVIDKTLKWISQSVCNLHGRLS